MALGRKKDPDSDPQPGLKEELTSFTNGVKSYLGARSELFTIEAKEAASKLGKKAGLGIGAVAFLFFGYLLLLIGLVGLLGQALSPDLEVDFKGWVGGAFILSALHLLPAIFYLLREKDSKTTDELFKITRAELKKDQEWLKNEKQS